MHTLNQLQNGELRGAISLRLSEGLTQFPLEIFELADTLEVLDLSGNALTCLPADFGRLTRLRILFCSDNLFTVLPAALAQCPQLDIVGFKANQIETIPPAALNTNLRWLILTNNRIAHLPKEIGDCARMQKLMLAGNRLRHLPIELSRCSNLSLLRISANRLSQLPAWLLSMPRLSWLAFSGNEFSISIDSSALPYIQWEDLHVHHVLGEGASGIIYRGVQRTAEGKKDIAVKVFKGSVTSDGLPEDEMNAFMAAGSHPGLVQLIAQIAGHPQGRHGLAMELIHPRFYNLGLPPSFLTCTRDVFKPGQTLTIAQAAKVAATISSIAAQLHSRGIMHGDLYAHNTLVDTDGNTLLSDFGAASFYYRADVSMAHNIERLEVNAFGHMVDDLLSLCSEAAGHPTRLVLAAVRDTCTAPVVSSRPGFEELNEQLMKLQEAQVC